MKAEDLVPSGKSGSNLVDALWEAFRSDRRDLHEAVANLTVHPDPVVREEALSLLLVKWANYRYRAAAATALIDDDDPAVRARAALGLASISTDATRREDAGLLLRALRDRVEDMEVRRAAYEALLLMVGEIDFPSRPRRFDPDKDVD